MYALEHLIEGEYRKYNNNAGALYDDVLRFTPNAFSHFTFERSDNRLIVVDVQGVGDLYTDPQIHTASGERYGEADLGIQGMALFFHSHRCNPICMLLNLKPFELSEPEKKTQPRCAGLVGCRAEGLGVGVGGRLQWWGLSLFSCRAGHLCGAPSPRASARLCG